MITFAPPDGNKPGFLYFEIRGVSEEDIRNAHAHRTNFRIPSKKRRGIRTFTADGSVSFVSELEVFAGHVTYRVTRGINTLGSNLELSSDALYLRIGSIRQNQVTVSNLTSDAILIPKSRWLEVVMYKGDGSPLCVGKLEILGKSRSLFYRPLELIN